MADVEWGRFVFCAVGLSDLRDIVGKSQCFQFLQSVLYPANMPDFSALFLDDRDFRLFPVHAHFHGSCVPNTFLQTLSNYILFNIYAKYLDGGSRRPGAAVAQRHMVTGC